MTASSSDVTAARTRPGRPGTTLVSLVAAKAGRECVWLLIAAAFCVVEVLVFLTELPTHMRTTRRESAKATSHAR